MSKDEKKIRLQTNEFYQHWLIVKELADRLEEGSSSSEIYDLLSFDSQIPLSDLFEIIDEHFAVRHESNKLRKILETRTV